MKLNTKWQVLIIVCVGIFMSTLDGSILNIANPTIAESFSVSMKSVQWIVTAYMLVITATLLFFGKLGDKIGNHKIYTWGFLAFTAGSLTCSLAPALLWLISARVFQAFGASMMMATGMGIVSNTFPSNERGKALGLTGSIVGIGNMAGPSLGGLLVANFNWPIIFLINIPIGLMGFFLACKFLPEQPCDNSGKSYDVIGTVVFATAAIILILSLSFGQSINVSLLITGIMLFIIFYVYEKYAPTPVLDFQLFKIKAFVYGNLMGVASYISQTFVTFLMPFYLERLLHFSPAYSGILMTLTPISMAITAPLAGNLSDRIGSSRLTSVAFILLTSAHLIFSTLNQDSSIYTIAAGLLILGIGTGLFGSPNNSSILGSVPREKSGYTGGFISTVRNLSFTMGIAASVSIFTYFFTINSKHTSSALAYGIANRYVYLISAAITLSGLVISLVTSPARRQQKFSENQF